MADLITADQWTERTGRSLSASELTQIEALIDDASALVIDIVNDATVTDAWDAASAGTVPGAIVPVVVAMVRRGLENPNGYTSAAIDDFRFEAAPSSGVYATREETRIIRRAASRSGVSELNLQSPVGAHWRYYADYWLDGAL